MRVLLLGGTTEASAMARLLAGQGVAAIFSYAGRTAAPRHQPLPTRIGGFGGAEGLARYLTDQQITHVVDATHPFAARMSWNAHAACAAQAVPLIALQRPAWQAGPGDLWTRVAGIAGAVAALPRAPTRVFLAIGRQHLAPFAALPHRWLLRLVDPPVATPEAAMATITNRAIPNRADPPLPRADLVIARGPFSPAEDRALMAAHAITHLVAKNSGGAGASAKLTAARDLGIRVVMIDRPALPERPLCPTPEAVLDWLHQTAPAPRGV